MQKSIFVFLAVLAVSGFASAQDSRSPMQEMIKGEEGHHGGSGMMGMMNMMQQCNAMMRSVGQESALDILKKRYARGEITRQDFEAMKKDIQ